MMSMMYTVTTSFVYMLTLEFMGILQCILFNVIPSFLYFGIYGNFTLEFSRCKTSLHGDLHANFLGFTLEFWLVYMGIYTVIFWDFTLEFWLVNMGIYTVISGIYTGNWLVLHGDLHCNFLGFYTGILTSLHGDLHCNFLGFYTGIFD